MYIPMNTAVYCSDGYCGRSTRIIIDPFAPVMRSLVVEERGGRSVERLIRRHVVAQTAPDAIRLRCARDDVTNMAPYPEVVWTHQGLCQWAPLFHDYLVRRGLISRHLGPAKRINVLPDEIAVHRGTHVETTSGRAGWFEAALVDPSDWHLTQLILRTGRLWDRRQVVVSILQIKRVGGVVVPVPAQPDHCGTRDLFAIPSKV